jgi:hypothetical protein
MKSVLKELVKAEANHESCLRRNWSRKGKKGEMIIKKWK